MNKLFGTRVSLITLDHFNLFEAPVVFISLGSSPSYSFWSMQSFLSHLSPMTTMTPSQLPAQADPVRVSVGHLLSRAYSLPCSTAAQAFTQLVQPTSRFQLALDALLPLLDTNTPAEVRCSQYNIRDPNPSLTCFCNSSHNGFSFLLYCILYMLLIRSLSIRSSLYCLSRSCRRGRRP